MNGMKAIFLMPLIRVAETLNEILYAIRIIDTKEGIVPNVNDEIVLYCAGGNRSLVAADTLIKMGYKNVKSLNGGTSSSS